ncbi:hypothetical protein CTAYLR_001038 [Chrysophaeum taylorii]|uniref:Uncharacterized protein n=1 Tax=Chrysophaeum taylorii TaxID=2483200 RepID=A0AAD7UFT1_9STRA|nr:hypothetical protein CTAYLR_001038 [Chrysophaeum taylorii]
MGGGATKQASPEVKRKDPKVVLEERIAQGREKETFDLLEKCPELMNSGLNDEDGMRPLQIACRGGHIDIVKRLLAKGAVLDQKNKTGATALMYAAAGGFDEICKLLLDAGADVRQADKNAKTALQYAQLHSKAKAENLLQMYACEYTW